MTTVVPAASPTEFRTPDGLTLRGRHHHGASDGPVVVMSHGFSGVIGSIEPTAEAFAAAGLHVLLYDHRNLGVSDGAERGDIDPVAQARDMRSAIDHAQSLPGVDPTRVGLWGTSFSGAHVLAVAAVDRRVRAVVSQVPLIAGFPTIQRVLTPDQIGALRATLDEERRRNAAGHPPARLPVVTPDPQLPAAFADPRSYEFLVSSPLARRATGWVNECTVRSLGRLLEYDVSAHVPAIGPTPLLLLVAGEVDATVPTDLALEAYRSAREPKACVVLPGDHYSPYYAEEAFPQASAASTEWLTRHLGSARG